MILKISGGTLSRNGNGLLLPNASEFLMDGDSEKEDLPTDKSIAVGSQAMKLNEEGITEVFIFGPSRIWYPYNGVSFLN